jgi:signal peptide peptidase SppA
MKINEMIFESEVLALMPEKLQMVLQVRAERLNQTPQNSLNIEAAAKRATKYKNIEGKIALLGIYGYISQKETIFSIFGLDTSSERFGRQFDEAINSPDIGAVVIDIDSPGGTVFGLTAVTDKIFNARGKKPIIAVSNCLMASAAYFIGSSADEIIADPDSQTGCIGTIAIRMDWSKFLETAGIKPTIFRSDEFKGEGNPYEPLTNEAKEYFNKMVADYADVFVTAVARNRKTTKADVKANFGKGRVMSAPDAKAVGMVDRLATFEQVIDALVNNKPEKNNTSRARAQLDLLNAKNDRRQPSEK